MTPKEAYQTSYMWHRLHWNEQITDEYYQKLFGLYNKHGLLRWWRWAKKSLNDAKWAETNNE